MRLSVWLRQEGVGDGAVTLEVGEWLRQTVTVGAEWKKFEFEFPASDPARDDVQRLALTVAQPGVFWIDNLLLASTDIPPFEMYPEIQQMLADWKPAVLRFWILHDNKVFPSLDSALFSDFDQRFSFSMGLNENMGFSLHHALALCRDLKSRPWLILSPVTPEEEIAGLMEYLGGDTNTAMGARRAAHGQTAPWTEVFSEIILECGNESWNNGFKPTAYPYRPRTYAAVANRLFHEVKKSPFHARTRFTLVANGWVSDSRIGYKIKPNTGEYYMDEDGQPALGWNFAQMSRATEANAIDMASYYGGWDGLTIPGSDDRDFFGKMLFNGALVHVPSYERAMKGRATLGLDDAYQIMVYEFGPGYAVKGAEAKSDASEAVGKSLAAGILTLDTAMKLMEIGVSQQAFFSMQCGPRWSIVNNAHERIPNSSFLALSMRNRLLSGDMREVAARVMTLDFPDLPVQQMTSDGDTKLKTLQGRSGVPVTTCYAFAEGSQRSVLLINRAFSQSRKVRLTLDGEPERAATLHTLAHADPRTTNRKDWNLKVEKKPVLDFHNDYELELPPCSATVIQAVMKSR